jgi:hypothetical protein
MNRRRLFASVAALAVATVAAPFLPKADSETVTVFGTEMLTLGGSKTLALGDESVMHLATYSRDPLGAVYGWLAKHPGWTLSDSTPAVERVTDQGCLFPPVMYSEWKAVWEGEGPVPHVLPAEPADGSLSIIGVGSPAAGDLVFAKPRVAMEVA